MRKTLLLAALAASSLAYNKNLSLAEIKSKEAEALKKVLEEINNPTQPKLTPE